ncbi:Activating molecule in BECN1-regulated autophagy protein 1B [Linum grandiflorum]
MPPPRSTIAAAFSPDGKTLASTHGDHTVKIIDCQTGKCLKVLNGHRRTPWVVVLLHPLLSTQRVNCLLLRQLYIWHYDKKGEASSPTVVLRTKRSLRAVHFHPHAAPFLLTAEVNDLDSSDSSMSRATSPGYLRYPPPAVFVANLQSSERVNVAAELPLMSLPSLFMPSFPVDDTRLNDNRDVSSSIMQVESSTPMHVRMEMTPQIETYPEMIPGSFPSINSGENSYMPTRVGTSSSAEDAMETDELPHTRTNQLEINAFIEGNTAVGGGNAQGSVRQQSQAGLPSVLPLNGGSGREHSSQLSGPSVAPHLSHSNMDPESGEATSAAAAAELPCTVKLRVWSHDRQHPCTVLNAERCRLTIPHAVLCSFGSVLVSRAIRAAHCLTSIQFSPTSEHILLAYGRRHGSLLKSIVIDGATTSPIYTVLEVWHMRKMKEALKEFEDLPNNYSQTNIALSPDKQLIVTGTSVQRESTTGGLIGLVNKNVIMTTNPADATTRAKKTELEKNQGGIANSEKKCDDKEAAKMLAKPKTKKGKK